MTSATTRPPKPGMMVVGYAADGERRNTHQMLQRLLNRASSAMSACSEPGVGGRILRGLERRKNPGGSRTAAGGQAAVYRSRTADRAARRRDRQSSKAVEGVRLVSMRGRTAGAGALGADAEGAISEHYLSSQDTVTMLFTRPRRHIVRL